MTPRTCGPCTFFTDLQGVLRLHRKCAGKCDDQPASHVLDLRDMGIKTFTPEIFHNLTEVQTLLIGENPLINVPGDIVSSLPLLGTVILNEVDLSKINLTMAGLKPFELMEIPNGGCGVTAISQVKSKRQSSALLLVVRYISIPRHGMLITHFP